MLGFMFSYYYCAKLDMDRILGSLDPMPPLIADSGAFTAWSKGASISTSEYAAWLHRWERYFPEHYANLDVKGDVAAGWRNQRALEEHGLMPMPVFHGGEPWKTLEDMCASYQYVGLGGIAGASMAARNPKALGWIERCFEIAREHGAGLHGFGMTNWQVVKRFPWRSVDSSSIGSGYRFGQVSIYDSYTKQWRKWAVKDTRAWARYGWLVRDYGFTPGDFARPRTQPCTQALMRLAARSLARAVVDLEFATQIYIVDDGGKQAGLRRVEVFNEANVELAA